MFRGKIAAAGFIGLIFACSGLALAADTTENVGAPVLTLADHYDYHYDEVHERSVGNVSWQAIRLTQQSAEEYPLVADALDMYNDFQEQDSSEMLANMIEWSAEDEYFPDFGMYYSDSILVRRADQKIVSFLNYHEDYTGGAHGYYSYIGNNIEVPTGKVLTASDVFTDQDALRAVVKEKLLQKYPDIQELWSLDDSLGGYGWGEDQVDYTWVMEPDGASFFFNPYELASYAAGMQNVTILYSEHPELFREPYKEPGNSYFKDLMKWYEETVSLPDGRVVSVSIDYVYPQYSSEEYADYSSYGGYNVSIGDATLYHEAYYYNLKPTLVYNGTSVYLYLECTSDNDWRWIDVIDISNGNPAYVGMFSGGFASAYDTAKEEYMKLIPSDLNNFRLDTRMNMLSTYTGWKNYYIGSDGMPIPKSRDYYRDTALPFAAPALVTTRELDGVNPDNGASVTVNAGENLVIIKTDGFSYVDLEREDGSMVRLYVDSTGYPRTINGIDEYECFEILYYAG